MKEEILKMTPEEHIDKAIKHAELNTPDTEDTSNTRKVHVNTLPVNTPDTEWREELEGRLFAYLGAMNMLGVMEGKTTDGTIVQRDKAVDDILQIVQSLLTSRDTYWKEEMKKARQAWLRSEIEKLEGMKEDERTMMGEDIRNMRKGRNVVIQTIITRYKEELKVLENLTEQ